MSSHKRSPDDDELDRLLRQARWPDARDEQTPRLANHWRKARITRRRRRLAYGVLAIAAGILLVVARLGWREAETGRVEVASESGDRKTEARPKTVPARNPQPVSTIDRAIVSRDPNLYEQVVLMRSMDKFSSRADVIRRADREKLVDELIDIAGDDAQADLKERLLPLQDDLAGCERQLWKSVRKDGDKRRLGAARLLSRIGSPRSLPVLMELAADPAMHEAAVLGLGRLAADRDLAQWASIERDAALRRQLLRMLLARNTPAAVGLYLAFVSQAGSRSEALGVITEMEDPPAELLLGYLESPQQPVRLAAALALSRVTDPAVVERVCASVAGISRREALIALLLSSSEKASGCLNEARENLYLVASVRAAEQQLGSLHIPRGGNLP